MLTLTDRAVSAIHRLTDQPEAPRGAGLRIAAGAAGGSLRLSVAGEPSAGDAVVESAGAKVFLDQDASLVLQDKALDAVTQGGNRVQFSIADQP
jgi:iron-sulfur cluster assembly protein